MTVAYTPVYTGKVAGDGTGDPGKVAFDKLNATSAALAAAIDALGGSSGSTYVSTTLSSDTANFSIGGTFPAGVSMVDFLLTTANVNLSGMQAGVFNGQTIWVRNAPGSTFTLTLQVENAGSTPANRWNGPTGGVGLFAGFKVAAVYNTTLARWVV
jgi:hypothetical protein